MIDLTQDSAKEVLRALIATLLALHHRERTGEHTAQVLGELGLG